MIHKAAEGLEALLTGSPTAAARKSRYDAGLDETADAGFRTYAEEASRQQQDREDDKKARASDNAARAADVENSANDPRKEISKLLTEEMLKRLRALDDAKAAASHAVADDNSTSGEAQETKNPARQVTPAAKPGGGPGLSFNASHLQILADAREQLAQGEGEGAAQGLQVLPAA